MTFCKKKGGDFKMIWVISHSAKGTTWKKHIYLKRLDGKYYYPDSYEGGRHLSSLSTTSGKTTAKTGTKIDKNKSGSVTTGQRMTMERKLNVVQKSGKKISGSTNKSSTQQQAAPQTPQIDQNVVNQVSAQVRALLSGLTKNSAGTMAYQRKDRQLRLANWKEKPSSNPVSTKKKTAKQIIRIGSDGRPINKTADKIEQILNSKVANPAQKASANKQKSGQQLSPADQANINAALDKIRKSSTGSSNKGNVDKVLSQLSAALKKKKK